MRETETEASSYLTSEPDGEDRQIASRSQTQRGAAEVENLTELNLRPSRHTSCLRVTNVSEAGVEEQQNQQSICGGQEMECRRGDGLLQQLEPEGGSREVAVISPSSHPSRMSDLFSFHFLGEDYLATSSPLQSSEDGRINAASHASSSLPASAAQCSAPPVWRRWELWRGWRGLETKRLSTVHHTKVTAEADGFHMDAGPEALVVKMSRGEQLQCSLTWKEKHAGKTANLSFHSHLLCLKASANIIFAFCIYF